MIFSLLLILSSLIPAIWNFLQVYYITRKVPSNIYPLTNSKKKFSIIVAEKNEDVSVIKELINNLLELDYDDYEIIIVSDDPPELFNKKYKDFKESEKLKIINRVNPKGGKAGALNYALKYAKYNYLVFLDADGRVDKDFLKKLSKYDFDITAYRIRIYKSETIIQKYYEEFTEKVMDSLFKSRYILGLPIFPNGSAFCINKDILIKLGGWKENIITEDLELGIRAFLQGYKIKYIDDVIVYSLAPYTLNDLYNQIQRWSYGSAQLFFESIKMIRRGIIGLEGVFYAQQWGIYGLFIFILLLFSALDFILKIPILSFLLAILIYGISLAVYSVVFAQKVNDIRLPLTILNASISGYIKGLFRMPFKWKITPKIKEKKNTENNTNILLPILLIFSYINITFGNIFPTAILLLFAFMEAVV
ncbi:glycosyltransferase family 2 protein [Sulfurisphaera javensis]|uniref:Glycosyltransferase family 2 protein n=1 Tax=Sulfurisphaera javensis TaxID=2049879 RepID=A0AAT9GRQ1_9CREN